jgi:hypothetical protein
MTEQTTRDYAQEVIDRQARETAAREAMAGLIVGALAAQKSPDELSSLRVKEWRLVSGTQTEVLIGRPDGVTVSITIKATED